jgi:hypothetical protein
VSGLASDQPSVGIDMRDSGPAKAALDTGGEANFHASVGGGEVIKAPTDLAPDLVADAGPAMAPAGLGGIMEMAAMPVIPTMLQSLTGTPAGVAEGGLNAVPAAELAAVLVDALPNQGSMDINALLDGLPSAAAAGGAGAMQPIQAGAAHMPMFITDLASFGINNMFDVAMASQDAAMAAGQA